MKYILFVLLMACTAASGIEGTYVCRFEHEFAKTDDTLVLRSENRCEESLARTEARKGPARW